MGFVGFRPIEQILQSIETIHELKYLLSPTQVYQSFTSSPSPETLRPLFQHLIGLSREETEMPVKALVSRIEKRENGALGDIEGQNDVATVVCKLDYNYGGGMCLHLLRVGVLRWRIDVLTMRDRSGDVRGEHLHEPV
jgi:hypothetical protein